MDVDRLQKINTLANELRKHNFALSSDEAYRQAEQAYEDGSVQQIVIEEIPKSKPAEDSLSTRKFELILEMNNKKYEQELRLFRSAINTLAHEIETLKAELHKMSEQAPPKQKEKQAELKTEVKEVHPRQGNFTPNDVDIQKMFYFGSRR